MRLFKCSAVSFIILSAVEVCGIFTVVISSAQTNEPKIRD